MARLYDCPVSGDGEDRQRKKAPPPADVPADWYPDPDSPRTLQRYWDGESWTGDTAPLPPQPVTESTAAIETGEVAETGDPEAIPAGWYADPDEPSTRRYWDGEEWTDWTDKTYERDLGRQEGSKNETLVTIGWITAVFIPIVGLILGIVISTRGDKRGAYVIVCSVVVFALSIVLIALTGNR